MRNFLNVMDQITVLGVMAIGMTLVILIGGIDLSVGSVLALSGMVLGYLGDNLQWPFVIAILVALIVSGICGLVSGLMVTRLSMPAFIATLAMMSIARGVASIITNGEQIVGFPDWFSNMAIIRHFGFLTVTVGVMVAITIIAWIILQFRPAGRALYAIGGSAGSGAPRRHPGAQLYDLGLHDLRRARGPRGASFSQPVSTRRSRVPASATSSTRSRPWSSEERSLSGGLGGIGGTAVGVLIIGFLRNGLNLLQVSPFVQQVIIGVVIAVAVAADTLRNRRG